MDIILRIVSRITQEGLFVDENLKTYSKENIISLIKQQKIDNVSSTEFYQVAKSILL